MYLKRVADKVRVLNLSPRWHLTPKTMNDGIAKGWLSLQRGKVVVHSVLGDISYDIVAQPGAYVKGSNDRLEPVGSGADRVYVFPGSDDVATPAEVEVRNYFTCVVQKDTVPDGTPSVLGGSVEAEAVRSSAA